MRVALYARCSTDDRGQDVESQLVHLRDYCAAKGWTIYREYQDYASATDLRRRTAWRELMTDAAKRRFDVVLVFKLDRAWRSTRLMHETLAAWELSGIQFASLHDPIDTTTPTGQFVLNILTALAEMERETIALRVRAGMERARRQGKHVGRIPIYVNDGALRTVLAEMDRGELSQRQAATKLGLSLGTFQRRLTRNRGTNSAQQNATEAAIVP